ncbi:ATP synthase subunit J ATP18 [Phycomyces blakesleeanus NRRL 1555(-)]|uniref:ATP synthase subunit J ATP18 n=1 Tax=Phycomyces blakesleeanus (strain ATCC 8743b / DSM 1359 / FGSC 10004 / NBRC 33097 / NRRL 1555) TaxID=763407 RepID=A0A167JFT9_PHYB8|nr:ATP synthase subunit J ATP18 [Phycomyces blakesleeanus NRRL 1555(-)]OAD65907.1 ATP synthase subunit J ATP18 [Phycomyces blakesleeanus NRRL 1555(-)]|eukprot:XP_018283947.1 ATP synthase subunit J ATP18 [Phycomyces blakesleeanus NRRL 1555(-)]
MFGLRKWSTPFLRPAGPFMVGGAVVFYLVAKMQGAMIDSDEYRNDPRNPAAGK